MLPQYTSILTLGNTGNYFTDNELMVSKNTTSNTTTDWKKQLLNQLFTKKLSESKNSESLGEGWPKTVHRPCYRPLSFAIPSREDGLVIKTTLKRQKGGDETSLHILCECEVIANKRIS